MPSDEETRMLNKTETGDKQRVGSVATAMKNTLMGSNGRSMAPESKRQLTDRDWNFVFLALLVAGIIVSMVKRDNLATIFSEPKVWCAPYWDGIQGSVHAVVALMSVSASYMFLKLFTLDARALITYSLIILTAVPVVVGGCLIFFQHHIHECLVVGISLIVAGLCFAAIAGKQTPVETAMENAPTTQQCIAMIPFSKLIPLVHICVGCILFFLTVMLVYTLWDPALNLAQRVLAIYLFIMTLWLQEINFGLKDFVLVYVSLLWQSSTERNVLRFAVCKAYAIAFRYHSGTIICGSLVLGITRPLQWLLHTVWFPIDKLGIPLGGCCKSALGRITSSINVLLRRACEYSYFETAAAGKPFFEASTATTNVLSHSTVSPVLKVKGGSTWIFQLAGVALIMGLSVAAAVADMHIFSAHTDFETEQGAFGIACRSALISAAISYSFMTVIGISSDTLLYCNVVDTLTRKPTLVAKVEGSWLCCLGCRGNEEETGKLKFGDGH